MRKRFIYDKETRKLIEVKKKEPMRLHNIQPDIKPYFSVASCQMVGSRSTRREDLKVTGCREVDPSEKKEFLRDRFDDHEKFEFTDKELYDMNRIMDRDGIRS